MLEKLPEFVGQALQGRRAGLENILSNKIALTGLTAAATTLREGRRAEPTTLRGWDSACWRRGYRRPGRTAADSTVDRTSGGVPCRRRAKLARVFATEL
jgi:hypothetical protein